LTAAVANESITPTDERVSAEFVRAEARPAHRRFRHSEAVWRIRLVNRHLLRAKLTRTPSCTALLYNIRLGSRGASRILQM
jgi:hypothetical protein